MTLLVNHSRHQHGNTEAGPDYDEDEREDLHQVLMTD